MCVVLMGGRSFSSLSSGVEVEAAAAFFSSEVASN